MKLKKKGFSIIVVSSILLLFAIVVTVSYDNWFDHFLSVQLDETSQINTHLPIIENLQGSNLYLQNTDKNSMNLSEVKIVGIDCNIIETMPPGYSTVNIGNCADGIEGKGDIIIVSNLGVKTKVFKFENRPEFDLYSIGNCEQLDNIRNNLSGIYYLTKNLYCYDSIYLNDNNKDF